MPPEQPNTNKPEVMDPRQKKKGGLDFWTEQYQKIGYMDKAARQRFIARNNRKEKMMEEKRLPQLEHYGIFESIEQIREEINPEENDLFIIRCTSKKDGELARELDLDLDGVCEYAEKLEGGIDEWIVEVKEFVPTKASGTVRVSSTGAINVEMWKGPHLNNVTSDSKYFVKFDPESDMSHKWTTQHDNQLANLPNTDISNLPVMTDEEISNLPVMKAYGNRALMMVHSKPFSRKSKTGSQIYAEFGFREDNGKMYFIEANDDPLLTEWDHRPSRTS